MSRRALALAAALALAGCESAEPELKQQLDELSQGLRGRVEPLPKIERAEPAAYRAAGLPDPFYPAQKKKR